MSRISVVYSALIVTYSCERSEKKTSVSAPSPGMPTVYSTSSPETACSSAGRSNGTAAPLEQTWTSSIQMSSGSGAVSGSAAPTAWAMRPQLGSPPWSAALTSGELATARATASTVGSWPPLTTTRPTRRAPSPSRTISSASRRSTASSASPKRSSSSDSGAIFTPLAPLAIRIAVSLVESWPSTEMRSKERFTHTPSSRSAVSGSSAASVWTKQSIVAKLGRDHPGALGLRGQAHGAARQRDVDRSALREQVGGADRVAERLGPVGRELPARAEHALDDEVGRQRHADHAGGGDRDALRVDADRHRRGALHLRGVVDAAAPGGRVRVAGVGHDRAQRVEPAALLAQHHGRGEHARAREARRAHRLGRIGDEQAEVGAAARLQPAGDAGGAEALRQRVVGLGRVLGQRDPAAHASPSLSSRPNIRLRFCTACDAAPFHRLSIAENTSTRPVRPSTCTEMRQ